MNRWRVGEDRGSKEMDGCPLTVGWWWLWSGMRERCSGYQSFGISKIN
jgi:hypothetical protein